MGRDPGAFQRLINIMYIVLGIACLAAFAASFAGGHANMQTFPLLFLLAAAVHFLTAKLNFRKDIRGRNKRSQGIAEMFVGIFLIILALASMLLVW